MELHTLQYIARHIYSFQNTKFTSAPGLFNVDNFINNLILFSSIACLCSCAHQNKKDLQHITQSLLHSSNNAHKNEDSKGTQLNRHGVFRASDSRVNVSLFHWSGISLGPRPYPQQKYIKEG